MKKDPLDLIEIKMKKIIQQEEKYSYPEFLIALRKCLGRTRQVVSYDLDIDYDCLLNHEEGNMSRKINYEKNDLLSEYYGVDPEVLTRKFREYVKVRPRALQSERNIKGWF